jgi:hypothetical protein
MKTNTKVVDLSEARLSAAVDRFAVLKAAISELEKEAGELKTLFLDAKRDRYEGALHEVVVVHSIRSTLVADKVRALLTPAAFESCQSTTDVHSVRVTGRQS